MRYINLLDKMSNVKTTKCFIYNNTIIFAVPKFLISKAIGNGASNLRIIQEKIGKKIKIIEEPDGDKDSERFVSDIVSPYKFKSIEIKDGAFVVNAGGTQAKAMLIGRNKVRLDELDKIIKDVYGLELRIA
jgi:transcription antitermination factor NusA-like protein